MLPKYLGIIVLSASVIFVGCSQSLEMLISTPIAFTAISTSSSSAAVSPTSTTTSTLKSPPSTIVTIATNISLLPTRTPSEIITKNPTDIAPSIPILPANKKCEDYPIIGGVISGTLYESTIYCIANEDLIVPTDEILNIIYNPTLVFAAGRRMVVNGKLVVRGHRFGYTHFTSVDEAGWNGIYFKPSASGSICNKCILENLSSGSTGVTIEAPISFQQSFIQGVPGGTAISSTVPFTLSNTIIDHIKTGLHLSGEVANQQTVTHLTLTRCQQGIVNYGQKLVLNNSILTDCDVAISTELSGTTTVSYTLFNNNQQDFHTHPEAQLIKGGGLLNEPPDFRKFPGEYPLDFSLRPSSAAINAADPQADYSQELGYNGGRADLGAFGNTNKATERPPYDQMSVTLETDTPTLIGQVGETITYTVILRNSGLVSDTYEVRKTGQNFGFAYGFALAPREYPDHYADVEPQEAITLTIEDTVIGEAAVGSFNPIIVRATGEYGVQTALQLTTIVSAPTSIEIVGYLGMAPQQVVVQNTYAYVYDSTHMEIIDISKPLFPVKAGSYKLPEGVLGSIKNVAVQGDYAYVIAGLAGLRIVDISKPEIPVEVSAYDPPNHIPGQAGNVSVSGNFAYVVWNTCYYQDENSSRPHICKQDLHIVDVSDPTRPEKVTVLDKFRDIRDLVIKDDYAYLATGYEGLRILDVTNPTSPVEVAGFLKPTEESYFNRVNSVEVMDNYAYITTYSDEVVVIDISNPTAPIRIGSYRLNKLLDVIVSNEHAFVLSVNALSIIDITHPDSLLEVGKYNLPEEFISGIAAANGYVYIPGGRAGLQIVDVSNPVSPTLVSSYGSPSSAEDSVMVDNYAYIADSHHGLRIIDVSNIATPVEIGFYNNQTGISDVGVVDKYAYVVSGGNRLTIVDVSNPITPVQISSYKLPEKEEASSRYEQASAIEVHGNYAYIVDLNGTLHLLNISDPLKPAVVEFDGYEYDVKDITLVGNRLYILQSYHRYIDNESNTTLSIVDVSNPAILRQVGSYTMPYRSYNVTVIGDYAYLPYATWWSYTHGANYPIGYNLRIVDISKPDSPTDVGVYNAATIIRDVAVSDHYAYMAAGIAGLRVVDISDPTNPQEIDARNLPGEAMKVMIVDNHIYVASISGGLSILRRPR